MSPLSHCAVFWIRFKVNTKLLDAVSERLWSLGVSFCLNACCLDSSLLSWRGEEEGTDEVQNEKWKEGTILFDGFLPEWLLNVSSQRNPFSFILKPESDAHHWSFVRMKNVVFFQQTLIRLPWKYLTVTFLSTRAWRSFVKRIKTYHRIINGPRNVRYIAGRCLWYCE